MASGTLGAVQARPGDRRWPRRLGFGLAGIGGVLLALVVAYSIVTTPNTRPGRAPLTSFDPVTLGRLEQQAWAAYYWRQWPRLFDTMLRMIRSAFGLSLPQAVYAAYLNTEAQIVWARQGAQDGRAEALMRQFYEYVKAPTGGRYDPARAAQLEVQWWAVHRNREQYPDRSALAQALAVTYAEVYQAPSDLMLPAGDARAAAMDLSDQWIREGKHADSPLLEEIATLLMQSYQALADAADSLP